MSGGNDRQSTIWQRLLNAVVNVCKRTGLINAYFTLLSHARHALSFAQTEHTLDGKLIVSLTSYPPRFANLSLTLKTLLSQSLKPDLIVLWIYERDLASLPRSVTSLAGSDFQIRTTSRDTRSFKKLVHCLTAFPADYIVTADDDVYYPRTWLAQLVRGLRPGTKEIIGHRGHCITVTPNQEIRPYLQWQWEIGSGSSQPPERVVLTGCGGILYPPNSLHGEVINVQAFNELCPSADDLWFYFMARLNHHTCRVISETFKLRVWPRSRASALYNENIEGGKNDLAVKKLVAAYGMPFTVGSADASPDLE